MQTVRQQRFSLQELRQREPERLVCPFWAAVQTSWCVCVRKAHQFLVNLHFEI